MKDNISVAGVDCLLGTSMFEGWVNAEHLGSPVSETFFVQKPTTDATVVTRILEAGGTLVGKAVCENLSLSPSSFSAATGPVHNPYGRGYSTGGSSSGCGVLVATGEVELCVFKPSKRVESHIPLIGLWAEIREAASVYQEAGVDCMGSNQHLD